MLRTQELGIPCFFQQSMSLGRSSKPRNVNLTPVATCQILKKTYARNTASSKTVHFTDLASKNPMRDCMVFFIPMRDLRETTVGPLMDALDYIRSTQQSLAGKD